MRIKNYISWSQYDTYKNKGINAYIRIYLEGRKFDSKYLDFGKKIAEGLEHRRKKTKDKDVLMARKLVPKFQFPEKEFTVTWGGIPLLVKLDGFGKEANCYLVDELKTGKNDSWKQIAVDKFEQITFYAAAVWQFHKIKPEEIKIRLHYLETYEDLDGSIHLTGFYKVFETVRTTQDFLKFYIELKKVWLGIEKLIDGYSKS